MCQLAIGMKSNPKKLKQHEPAYKMNFTFVRKDLQTSEMCLYIINGYRYALRYMRQDLQTEEICNKCVDIHNIRLFRYVRKDLQTEKMCEMVLQKSWTMLEHVREDLQTEKMCLKALKMNLEAFKFISFRLRNELPFKKIKQMLNSIDGFLDKEIKKTSEDDIILPDVLDPLDLLLDDVDMTKSD